MFDNGRLRNVKDAQGTTLWLTVSENEYGQITSYSLGNQVIGELSYSDTTHLLRRQFAQKGIDNCPGFPLQLRRCYGIVCISINYWYYLIKYFGIFVS